MTTEDNAPVGEQPDSASVAASKEETTGTKAAETPVEGKEAETAGDKPDPAKEAEAASEAAKTLSKRKQTMQERVNELTHARREAERKNTRLEAELALLKGKMKAPVASEYEDVGKLTADQVNHTLDQRRVNELEAEKTDAQGQAKAARAQAFATRVEDFKASGVTDFEEIAFRAPIGEETAEILADLDEGPQVAYHLGKNHSEARRIDTLPAREKAIALGKLAERLTATPTRRTTQAPQPVNAVAGKNAGRSDFNAQEASMEDYVAKRKQGWGG